MIFNLRKRRKDNTIQVLKKLLQVKKPFHFTIVDMKTGKWQHKTFMETWRNTRVFWKRKSDPWTTDEAGPSLPQVGFRNRQGKCLPRMEQEQFILF